MIENKQITIDKTEARGICSLPGLIRQKAGNTVLRWYVAQITSDEYIIEATLVSETFDQMGKPAERLPPSGKSVALNIVPTGIGCSIGGYAGDASPVTNLLASAVDYLITNPNAVNASNFIGLDSPNIIYADGCSIDMFCQGSANFYLPYANRIGLVIDKTDSRDLDVIFNVVNTVRAVHGIDILDYVIADRPIGGRCIENKSGAFAGAVDNPEVLYEAVEKLIGRGATAIAVTSNIADLPLGTYAKHFQGEYANPVGGVEAIISYLITSKYQIPTAHAPLMNVKELDLRDKVVDARGAGEMASESGLACILIGLRGAPQIRQAYGIRLRDSISMNNLLALVVPASSLGGIACLCAQENNIPIIAVEDNRTILDVSRSKTGLENVLEARSYAEATGLLLALKKGLQVGSLTRPLAALRY